MAFQLTSTAFEHGGMIPSRYTCDGEDISPPLTWQDPPANTKSFALICDDPDAPVGTWVHWLLFNIPADRRSLPEEVPTEKELPDGGKQGLNDFRRIGYGGPCPPGGTHRYFFRLYALDAMLDVQPGCSRSTLEKAMTGHILARAELMGKYAR